MPRRPRSDAPPTPPRTTRQSLSDGKPSDGAAPGGARRAGRRARRGEPHGVLARSRALLGALRGLGPGGLRYLERAIELASRRAEVTYTREGGRTVVIRVLGVPALLGHDDVAYLHGACMHLLSAFHKTVAARRHHPEVLAALPLSPVEEEWLDLAPLDAAPIAARWDLNIAPGRAREATLFEVNGCAVGGIHYSTMSSEIVRQVLEPLERLGRELALPDSFRGLWRDLLDEQAALFTREGRAAPPADGVAPLGRALPRVVWLEDRTWDTGITEGPSLTSYLDEAGGPRATVADPRDLTLRGGEIWCDGERCDVIYRSIEVRDLAALEERPGQLDPLREAFRRGRVISPPAGDLDHKSMLEVWSTPSLARLFSAAERAVLRRHVPWTRLLGERRTEGPDGAMVDLPELTRRQRARLVIKPNRACGGEGVLIGRDTSQAAWERAIAAALSGRAPAVVQSLVESARIRNPIARGGAVALEEHYTTFGLFATSRGLGFLGRAAPFPVVNVSRGGGLLGVLIV